MKRLYLLIILCLISNILSGCATNTSNLHVDTRIDYVASSKPTTDAPTAYISDIQDGRKFVDRTGYPGNPTPAISSAEERARSVGRKRNGFGKALGDFKLKDGQTVQGIVREILDDALIDSGFNVIHDSATVTKDTLCLNVTITKYWTWIDLGFWQSDFVTDIATDIKTNKIDNFNIEASESVGIQFGTDKNALKSINRTISKFRSAATTKFKELYKKTIHNDR